MRRGDYGYDAPYILMIFGVLSVATGIGAAICWQERAIRVAVLLTFLCLLFLLNVCSFLYTTRRGKFIEWERILDALRLRGD